MIQEFEFSWPWIMLLLPLPLLLRRENAATRINAPAIAPGLRHVLNQQAVQPSGLDVGLTTVTLWLAWLFLLLALAQPSQTGSSSVQPVSGRAIALAVDLSGSMQRRDFILNGETGDRLTIVKRAVEEFLDKRQGDRFSLVLYGREAFVASPLTFDLQAIVSILNSAGIGMAGRSTAIGDALGLSIQTLSTDPSPSKAIVLLSDGTNNAGAVEPESAAELANRLGIRIHTIALGSKKAQPGEFKTAPSADLDEKTLSDIAELAEGHYFRAASTDELRQIYTEIDKLERSLSDSPPVLLRKDLYHWPLITALLLLIQLAVLQRKKR